MSVAPKGLTTAAFFAKNDDLAQRYPLASESARRNILDELYKLDLHLFQAWRVLGEDREDYKQSAVLWLARALETYKPGKGPFVHWLRFYVQKTFTAHVRDYKSSLSLSEAEEDHAAAPEEEEPDPVFWRALKAKTTPEEWDLIERRFLKGQDIQEIAKDLGTYPEKIRGPIKEVLERFKVSTIKPNKMGENFSDLDDAGARWIKRPELGRILGLSPHKLNCMTNPNIPRHYTSTMIHPHDIIRVPTIRIRFLLTDKGLIYPRLVPRPKIKR
jgi:RNA polymerase sigma factor (sigma-70 family)